MGNEQLKLSQGDIDSHVERLMQLKTDIREGNIGEPMDFQKEDNPLAEHYKKMALKKQNSHNYMSSKESFGEYVSSSDEEEDDAIGKHDFNNDFTEQDEKQFQAEERLLEEKSKTFDATEDEDLLAFEKFMENQPESDEEGEKIISVDGGVFGNPEEVEVFNKPKKRFGDNSSKEKNIPKKKPKKRYGDNSSEEKNIPKKKKRLTESERKAEIDRIIAEKGSEIRKMVLEEQRIREESERKGNPFKSLKFPQLAQLAPPNVHENVDSAYVYQQKNKNLPPKSPQIFQKEYQDSSDEEAEDGQPRYSTIFNAKTLNQNEFANEERELKKKEEEFDEMEDDLLAQFEMEMGDDCSDDEQENSTNNYPKQIPPKPPKKKPTGMVMGFLGEKNSRDGKKDLTRKVPPPIPKFLVSKKLGKNHGEIRRNQNSVMSRSLKPRTTPSSYQNTKFSESSHSLKPRLKGDPRNQSKFPVKRSNIQKGVKRDRSATTTPKNIQKNGVSRNNHRVRTNEFENVRLKKKAPSVPSSSCRLKGARKSRKGFAPPKLPMKRPPPNFKKERKIFM